MHRKKQNQESNRGAIIYVFVLIGVSLVLVFAPWKRIVGLEKYSVGISRGSGLRSMFVAPFENWGKFGSIEDLQVRIEAAILSEVPVGTPVTEVVVHINDHFVDPDLSRKNDWYDREKWHYRFDVVREQKDFGTATFSIDYAFKDGMLDSVSAYFSSVGL